VTPRRATRGGQPAGNANAYFALAALSLAALSLAASFPEPAAPTRA